MSCQRSWTSSECAKSLESWVIARQHRKVNGDTHNVWIFCCSHHISGGSKPPTSLSRTVVIIDTAKQNVDIDLVICRHATTRGDRASRAAVRR